MSKEPVVFEKATPQMLSGDITNLVKTNTTKAQAMEKLVLTSHGLITGRFDSSLSTIEGLGARGLMSFLSSEEVQSLVDNIHAAEAVHRLLPSNDQVVVEKSKLNAAKNEAALKGYELPTSNGGPSWEIFKKIATPFTDEEKNIAFSAAKEALVAVANTQIPSADYADRVQEEYVKIIKRDHPELSPEILAGLQQYASRGVVKKEGQNFSELEKAQIRETALKTREEFSEIFVNHKNRMQNPGQNVILEENVLSKFGRAIISKFEDKGYMIDPKTKKEIEDLAREKVKLLDPSRIESMSVRELVDQLEPQLLAESPRLIVLKAINVIEKEKNINVSESQAQKIVDKLAPGLAELDPEYLRQNSQVITEQIQKALIDRSTVAINALGGLYVREAKLDTVSSELLKVHTRASDLQQQQSIENSLLGLGMKNSKLAEKLTELGVEKAKATKYDLNTISYPDLARMRRANPKEFDRIVLSKKHTPPNREEVIFGIIDQAVDKLQQNGVKLTPEKEKDFREKCKVQLGVDLSKLDTEYLQKYSDTISSNIQKELYKNRSIGYRFGMQFSVSTESLVNISRRISSDYQKASAEFELSTVEKKVKEVFGKSVNENGKVELEEKLTALAVEKAMHRPVQASDMSKENLLRLRKENPARFDRVVLGKEPAKRVVAAPVKEQGQVVAPPSLSSAPPPPPPLLSARQKDPAVLVKEQPNIMTGVPLAPPPPLDYVPSSAHDLGMLGKQELLASAFREQEGARPPSPALPSSALPPRDGGQGVQEVPAALPNEPQVVKRPPPPPRSRFGPPPRDDGQSDKGSPAALPNEPQGATRPPPPPPRNRSQNGQEAPAVSTGAPFHPPTTPHPRLTPEGRKGGLDR